MKILLLEDDLLLNEIIEEFLLKLNYEVTSVFNGNTAEELIYQENFDLLLFDINVPDITGFDLIERIRDNDINIPFIFISSRNTQNDLKKGFDLGCDDYLKKPFHLSELKLRIENIKKLRHIESSEIIQINNYIYYDYALKVIKTENNDFDLSKRESKLMEYFIKNRNRILSIEEISMNNWVYDEIPEPTTIRTYIKNLRKKLGNEIISTQKGIGYIFVMKIDIK
jgi:DNA-binding response OmpR family regulator